MVKKMKKKISNKLKRKIDTMHLGRIYFDKVLENKKEMIKKDKI